MRFSSRSRATEDAATKIQAGFRGYAARKKGLMIQGWSKGWVLGCVNPCPVGGGYFTQPWAFLF